MGASCWHHIVPYDSDVAGVLSRLRADVFAAGTYYWTRKAKPKSIEEAVDKAAEDGTHSVLDIDRVVHRPPPAKLPDAADMETWMAELTEVIGGLCPLPAAQIEKVFGRAKPDRDDAESNLDELFELCPRGVAIYVPLYANGKPIELLIAGVTGD